MSERKSWYVTVPVADGELLVTDPVRVDKPYRFTVKDGRVRTDEAGALQLARAFPEAIADPPPSADPETLTPELQRAAAAVIEGPDGQPIAPGADGLVTLTADTPPPVAGASSGTDPDTAS